MAIITAKPKPKLLPPSGIQKERIDFWKRQPFVSLTNGVLTSEVVRKFAFQFETPATPAEMEGLTNSVVHFVDAFRLGTFDAYKQFRAPVRTYSFESNFAEAVATKSGIAPANLAAESDQAWRHYWDTVVRNRYSNYWVGISPQNCDVVVEQTSSPSNDLRYAMTQGSPEMTFESIMDLPKLANELCRPRSSKELAAYLLNRLPADTKQYLERYQGGISVSGQKEVVDGLNDIIESGPIYSPDLFRDTPLSADTMELLKHNPKGKDLVRLNRLLLVDAFPDALCRRAMVANVGISFMRPTVELIPSRAQVVEKQGVADIATIRILAKSGGQHAIFPIYLRMYWSQANKTWLPEQLIAAYARPDRNGDLLF